MASHVTRRRPLRALAACLAACLASPALSRPVLTTIAVDGDLADWNEVLTNPENQGRDGDGSSLGCSGSSDRDCPVASGEDDLSRLAWTWDSQNLYVLIERFEPGAGPRTVLLYVDADDDGRMETGEKVAVIPLSDLIPTDSFDLYAYGASQAFGDPVTDAAGFADGYTLPGTLGLMTDVNSGTVAAAAPAAKAWEAGIKWSKLGLFAGRAVGLHLSLSTAATPLTVTDNAGASDGGAASTGFRDLALWPDRSLSAAPGQTLDLVQVVANGGNLSAFAQFLIRSEAGKDLDVYTDPDGDGVPDGFAAHDAGGDGVLTLPGDVIAPGSDTNGDGILDGRIGGFTVGQFIVRVSFAPTDGRLTERITVEGWIDAQPEIRSRVVDLIRVGDVTLSADATRTGVAADVAWLPHVLQSNLAAPTVVDLSVADFSGWTWDVLLDPNADGDPADAAALPDTDASGLPDVTLQPGQAAALFARARVPPTALPGTVDRAFVRAHLGGAPESVVTDRVIVTIPVDLYPSHELARSDARYGGAGGSIYFAHDLVNHRGTAQPFDVTASTDAGWPAVLLLDPDGDGRPWDAVPLAGPPTLPANGGAASLLVRVDVPAGARLGERATATVTARSQATGESMSVLDDAIAAIIRLYDDPSHVVNVNRLAGCATGYAAASGLPPGATDLRFAWRDPSGAILRAQAVATDSLGACEDVATLPPGAWGAGYRVEIQQWDGVAWTTLDQAAFAVGDRRAASVIPGAATTSLLVPRLTAEATFTDAFADPAEAADLRWVVLTPDRSEYLGADGALRPYSGTEATTTASVVLDGPETRVTMLVLDAAFRSAGTHVVELRRGSSCLPERLEASATFEVIDDPDGDGIDSGAETALGLDPFDDDSDDDGLGDGADGTGDADGDGLRDALDCDSDGDGLGDGLESGATTPLAGTSAGGCFVPDASPATVTDPDVADTDGGGAPDGDEDRDGDGLVDASERDPLDAADDAAACSPAPPAEVTSLRVARAGADVALSWAADPDPCVTSTLEISDALPAFTAAASGLRSGAFRDAATSGPLRAYRVRATSWLSGDGPR